jgi:hypothetical protein
VLVSWFELRETSARPAKVPRREDLISHSSLCEEVLALLRDLMLSTFRSRSDE